MTLLLFAILVCSEAVACLTGEANDTMRLYEDLGNYSNIKPIFERILELYNAKHKRMNLVGNQHRDRNFTCFALYLLCPKRISACAAGEIEKQGPMVTNLQQGLQLLGMEKS
eukprot:1158274-Pelagomonas_calceolata.AAC.40